MKSIATLLITLSIHVCYGQSFNVGNQNVNFGGTGVTIVNKVGSGTATGDVVLYENVITIGSQQIDGIVRTVYTDASMINFDNPSTSGASMTNNQPRFFSPQFNFSGAGHAEFRFEFILAGTYNNSTDSGTIVNLENIVINTYDIDGNGSSGTNQYNEFGGFDSSALGNPTNIGTSYNTTSGLTKFRSNTSSNISNVLDDRTRVNVSYAGLSSFTIIVGAEAGGFAYFFIDFGPGPNWSSTPDVFTPPVLDLDTTTTGINRIDTFCNTPSPILKGGANLSSSTGNIDEIYFSFTTTEIIDGADEMLIINGAASGDTIPLNFSNGASISNIVLNGVSYSVTATVSGGKSQLSIQKTVGTLTTAEAEMLLDSLAYYNAAPTSGIRTFELSVRDGAFTSPGTQYQVLVSCSFLAVELVEFNVTLNPDQSVLLSWTTASEKDNAQFLIEKSVNSGEWLNLQQISGNGTTNNISHYAYIDNKVAHGSNCYKLIQVDFNGARTAYPGECVIYTSEIEPIIIFPNPNKGILKVDCISCVKENVKIFDNMGMEVSTFVEYQNNTPLTLDLSALANGIYYLQIETANGPVNKSLSLIR